MVFTEDVNLSANTCQLTTKQQWRKKTKKMKNATICPQSKSGTTDVNVVEEDTFSPSDEWLLCSHISVFKHAWVRFKLVSVPANSLFQLVKEYLFLDMYKLGSDDHIGQGWATPGTQGPVSCRF